ncbi:PREDICTED: peptidyl-prolyl cis-trans isomerase CYP19-1-like [Camelina sativa]|uniref:Peptidyl-prolyl cis-trans isomerase n=1 Tax=Camelina sativa TaxID=90675 RepID=A0ABM0Z862_CAMSA|nr:PREDICTED: peptidyl-prolyl cis-trans isomerase CYP19-1-like [Camelina sativa]
MTQSSVDARLEALEKSHDKVIADTNRRLSIIENDLDCLTETVLGYNCTCPATVGALRATAVGNSTQYISPYHYVVSPYHYVVSPHQQMAASVNSNPKVFFEFTVGGRPAGRIVMELYADTTPVTAENFRVLCTGERGIGKTYGKPLHYKGTTIDGIRPRFMWTGGNIVGSSTAAGDSIYGGVFRNENYIKRHDRPGVLSMAVGDPHTNACQFQIVLEKFPLLDGVHVVFGQVIEGFDVIRSIEDEVFKTFDNIPSKPVVIADCGQLSQRSI